MTSPSEISRVATPALEVEISTGRIVSLFERAPHKTYFHIRATFGDVFEAHRQDWLQRTGVKFRDKRSGIKVPKVKTDGGTIGNETARGENRFFYGVSPRKRSVPKNQTPRLEAIAGRAYTHSKAALGLEKGGAQRPKGGRYLTIPIGFSIAKDKDPKANYSSLAKFKGAARLVNKETVVYSKPGRNPIVYLKKTKTYKRKGKKNKTTYLPIFLLVRATRHQPRLKFVPTWEALGEDRDRRFSRALSRIIEELEAGK